ncbi:MAG: TA system VapC family ribonuclease toxin [Planctomycetota bacterium]
MILIDVNVLIYAHREDAPDHTAFRQWLEKVLASGEPFGTNDHILSGVLRVVTHPRVFDPPSPLDRAIAFLEEIRSRPSAIPVVPGPRHWSIFADLCRAGDARGNLVPDAYFAALAIESGSEWITTDRGYARFPGLRWRHPLAT